MIRVKNRRVIQNLAQKGLVHNRLRNLVAILAIALTTLLFTALFTIALSIGASFQDANFRQAGGKAHGSFKYLSQEEYHELKMDEQIKETGLRRLLGMPREAPFSKHHVELGYSDKNQAHWMFCDPIEGRLPMEDTQEAATDTYVLELLGIEPKIGEPFTVTFEVDGQSTTQSFILCGWWERDEAVIASHILVPESRVDQVIRELGVDPSTSSDRTGSYNLDVMFSNAWNIEKKMHEVLARHGYQAHTPHLEDNYILLGINWGYMGSQFTNSVDLSTVASILLLLLLIMLTGYLIIYNVFQISVVNDIRFYGLLKAIGTTPRQLRQMIRLQAFLLSLIGIPVGLFLGWLLGNLLTPVVGRELSGISSDMISIDPLIFIVSTLFSLSTVLLSCSRPGRLAGATSPIEALRYNEGSLPRQEHKRSRGVSLLSMARENLLRSRGKTVITVLSLSLAVLLFTMTITFTRGFDMDKYLARMVTTDFVFADADYFSVNNRFTPIPLDAAGTVLQQEGIANAGLIYAGGGIVRASVPTEVYLRHNKDRYPPEELDQQMERIEKDSDGRLQLDAQLYGMEAFALDCLELVEGDLGPLYEPDHLGIAAVYRQSDFGDLQEDSHWAKIGDIVTLRYVEDFEYIDPQSGKPVDPDSGQNFVLHVLSYREVSYRVEALVVIPNSLSYRYYWTDQYVLNNRRFIQDSGTQDAMLLAFDMQSDEERSDMEDFLRDYTDQKNPEYDYESKEHFIEDFNSFRNMFLLLGGVLSAVVGLVGILNYFNAILTSILVRRREFALLQSIGMTGRQLKTLLILEGLGYTLASLALTLLLILTIGPLLAAALESFWFFSYRLTLYPIGLVAPIFVLLGTILPIMLYRWIQKQSLIERLRASE